MVEIKKITLDKSKPIVAVEKTPANQLTRYTPYNQHSACKLMLGREAPGPIFRGELLVLWVNILNIQPIRSMYAIFTYIWLILW